MTSLALVGGCSGSSETEDPGLSHVHGLGVNPADDQLYVATHHGVFRIDGREAQRQGNLLQDTMGFTIAGPDRFLASGHPDPGKDTILDKGMRPLLGLIESTNRATSWQALSLRGEVDFHALGFAHGQVYGFDATSGRFMVSSDTRQWDIRSQVSLSSFAVSPVDPERIVGARGDMVGVASTDGGRSWTPVAGSTRLAFVSWDAQAGLWSIGPDGAVASSQDEGATWSQAGKLTGTPEALLAHPKGLFAATSAAIYESADRGATWSTVYRLE